MIKFIKNILRPLYLVYIEYRGLLLFKKLLKSNEGKKIKLVVGSSGLYEKDWIPSEYYFLNLLKEQDWFIYFKENQIDNILSEHVWEHLTLKDGEIAAKTCFKFLKSGGRLRVAVPDGFHPNEEYINYVKPGGYGAGAHDHKILYNYHSFSKVFSDAGFKVNLLEYFDESGYFNSVDWSKDEGYIHRSIRYDERNVDKMPNYTSLIIDAVKP